MSDESGPGSERVDGADEDDPPEGRSSGGAEDRSTDDGGSAAGDERGADPVATDPAEGSDDAGTADPDREDDAGGTAGEADATAADAGPGAGPDGAQDAGPDAASNAGSDAAPDAGPEAGAAGGGTGIDPEDIDPAELTVPERSLHPRVRILWILRAVLLALVAGGIAAAADAYYLDVGPALPLGVAGLLLVLGVVHALLRYRIWRYEVRADALYLERGVVTRVRTVVPFVRIQHVDTSRGPVERATGLATSVVYTAGSRGADVAIPGLEADRAEDLQRRLKRLAIASEGDAAV